MSNVNDILSSIYTGRFVAERARADHLARALSEVEDLVREMGPTEAVTIEGGNTADLADAEDMRSLLMEQGQEPSAAGLAETMSALRRALGCPDGASAGQILAEVNRLRGTIEANNAEHERVKREQGRLWLEAQESIGQRQRDNAALRAENAALSGDLSILAAECARIDRAIAPLWTGDPGDCIGKRVESVAKAAHARAETVDSLYDKIRERDAQIAALTPGPWTRLGDMAPNIGETVLMWSGVQDTPAWMQVFYGTTVQSIAADYLWRRIPAGLLDVPALAVAPANAQPEGAR